MRKTARLFPALIRFVVHLWHSPCVCRDACAALMIAAALAQNSVRAETPDARVAKAAVLAEVHGHRTLRLLGNDMGERGFAHGYLLAKDIMMELESSIRSLPGVTVDEYNKRFLPWSRSNFTWDADAVAELDGLYAGMRARLGDEGLKSSVLGRPFTRDDITGMNTLADYFGPACSAFCAWGERTASGEVIHGRTLDFPIGADAVAVQVILINEALPDRGKDRPARKAFIAVTWPGMITQYTGMNSDGLVACIHDGYNTPMKTWHALADNTASFLPRGLLLRRILETIDPSAGDPAAAAAKMAAAYPTACGNLFHLSWPNAAATKTHTQPSAVLEFEPSSREAVIRLPEQPGYIVLTNHFCKLNAAVACDRCAHITEGLELLEKAKRSVGLSEARKLLKSAEQPVAAHSVYFLPDTMEFYVALSKRNVMSPSVVPTKFTFDELLPKH